VPVRVGPATEFPFLLFFRAVLKDFLLDFSCACSSLGADVRVGVAVGGGFPSPHHKPNLLPLKGKSWGDRFRYGSPVANDWAWLKAA